MFGRRGARRRLVRRLSGVGVALRVVFTTPQEGLALGFLAVIACHRPSFDSCPIRQHYRTSPHDDKRGGLFAIIRDKAPPPIHPTQVIRADPNLLADLAADLGASVAAPLRQRPRAKRTSTKTPEWQAFPAPPPVPSWARVTGRAGQGDPLFFAGAGLALLDAFLRRDPPPAGALRCRLAVHSAVTCAKILRLRADEAALRDLRFAIGDEPGLAAKLLGLWRDLAARRPRLDRDRIVDAGTRLGLAPPDPERLATALHALAEGPDDPVSAAVQAAALAFAACPDAPSPEAEVLALWVADLILALRLRWARPLPLIATKILDPALRSDRGGRPRPGEPAWSNTAAGAVALAAGSALDLAADLSRRSDALLEVAPKLRAKPAAKIVDLLLTEDCVSPAEAARHAPMTDRAARRLFDRLVARGAAREFSGRPTFRLYGL